MRISSISNDGSTSVHASYQVQESLFATAFNALRTLSTKLERVETIVALSEAGNQASVIEILNKHDK